MQADHVGYRDQRFYGALNDYGKVKVSFEWNQIPLFFSEDTRTLFTTTTPLGQLRIDDPVQSGAQTSPQTIRVAAANLAQPFDLRLKRSIGDVRALYSVNENLDLSLFVQEHGEDGDAAVGGHVRLQRRGRAGRAGPDTHTTEVGVAGEWANRRGLVRVGYDGSFFRNETDLVWDNPLRITDSPTAGPLQGRMSLWPDSNMNAANVSGMVNLPKNSRATAYLSVGNWTQNDILIPFTINTALPTIPLDRTTADTQAHVTSMNYTFSSRPSNTVWFSARYWSYDFDNRTPEFHVSRDGDLRHDRGHVRGRRNQPVQPRPEDVRRRRLVHAVETQRVPRRLHACQRRARRFVPWTRPATTSSGCRPTRQGSTG